MHNDARTQVRRTAAALAVIFMTACGGNSAEEVSDDGDAGSGTTTKVGVVLALTSVPFMQTLGVGAKAVEADLPGLQVTLTGPPAPDAQVQNRNLQDVLSTGAKGVVIMPQPAELFERALSTAAADGVSLVAVNSPSVEGGAIGTYVAQDDVAASESLIEALADQLGPDASGTVVVGNCSPGNATIELRVEVFQKEIARLLPGVNVVGPVQTSTEPAKNFSVWEQVARANREAIAFVGSCELDGPSIIKVKKQDEGDYELVTFDVNPEIMAGIQDGTMLAANGGQPWLRGYVSTRLAAEAAMSGEPVVEGFVDLEGEMVTKENVDEVLARDTSPDGPRKAWAEWIDTFFEDPAAQMRPIEDAYAR